jgi:hypothetical protein
MNMLKNEAVAKEIIVLSRNTVGNFKQSASKQISTVYSQQNTHEDNEVRKH